MIKSHQCENIPKGLARRIMEASDTDNDNRLDFNEFYEMSKEHEWLLKSYVTRYCKLVVPQPNRVIDEPGLCFHKRMIFFG